ncbi:MAG: hypothetical protein GY906_05815 [bacterium]|nr:hypothetical protein [bacterium]
MKTCEEFRLLLGSLLDGGLEPQQEESLQKHCGSCPECGELFSAMQAIDVALQPLDDLSPPDSLLHEIAHSPCRRWLSLLSQAVDREISESNLDRLISHLEGCETCRQTWSDLSLIHQVGEALEPSQSLLQRCIAVRVRKPRTRVLGSRAATAAAYFLAVLTSILVGNPVTLGRSPAGDTVQKVATSVTVGMTEVAEEGRGEARMMLWKAWNWGNRQVNAVKDIVGQLTDEDSEQESAKEVPNDQEEQP